MWCSCETVLLQQSLLTLPCLISCSLAGKALSLSCAGNVVGKNFSVPFWNDVYTGLPTTESCLVFLSLQLVQSFVSKTAAFSLTAPMLRAWSYFNFIKVGLLVLEANCWCQPCASLLKG